MATVGNVGQELDCGVQVGKLRVTVRGKRLERVGSRRHTAPDPRSEGLERWPEPFRELFELTLLEADQKVALAMVAKAGEKDLGTRTVPAPWNPEPRLLGLQLLHMVQHLQQHKGQLFYYLKLQGKPVHTGNLWGM